MSRKNFVAWYIRENPLTLNLLRRSQQNPEVYEWIGTEMEWQAWKAATEEQDEQLTIAKQRIAQLEKDCEILQTNLDDADELVECLKLIIREDLSCNALERTAKAITHYESKYPRGE